jgi:hypothetical protein
MLYLRGKKGRQPDVDLAETDEARSVKSTLGDRRGAERALAGYLKEKRWPQFRQTSRSSPTQTLCPFLSRLHPGSGGREAGPTVNQLLTKLNR